MEYAVEFRDPATLAPHPKNWAVHPESQSRAIEASLRKYGWLYPVIYNERTGRLIDGHDRRERALQMALPYIPVHPVDVDEATEREMLLVINRTSDGRGEDPEKLLALFKEQLDSGRELPEGWGMADFEQYLAYCTPAAAGGESVEGEAVDSARRTLAERFGVPPFSVLDARQGYWQTRKRAWIALGIESELGRGECMPSGAHNCYSGDSEWSGFRGGRRADASPGGSPRDAASLGKNGRTVRGDGTGKPLAASFTCGGPSGLSARYRTDGKRLTWVPGARDDATLDETSRKNLAGGRKGGLTWTGKAAEFDGYCVQNGERAETATSGTSIFDPVLCELAYRWFCPEGGMVLDPFAGGSVRGIVAARLGRAYLGFDLSERQVEANRVQWARMRPASPPDRGCAESRRVRISAKSARLKFNGCEPEFIRTVCHGRCCEAPSSKPGILVTIDAAEKPRLEALGARVVGGLLQPAPEQRLCPFKTSVHLCGLHETPDKPFICIVGPFHLNANNTLIVRNRYKLLKCYNTGPRLPAYKAFHSSLVTLFGAEGAATITTHLDSGGGDLVMQMPAESYRMLVENGESLHAATGRDTAEFRALQAEVVPFPDPEWRVGDAREELSGVEEESRDFFFSCPPYGDLERYSEDPRDLSTLPYPAFLEAYREIIRAGIGKLKENRFACFVVGDIRDKRGFYRNFVGDTVVSFQDAGAILYNEAILVTAVGSLPIRVGQQFAAYRKLGKTHQNVLVFYKGDPRAIGEIAAECEFGDLAPEGEDSENEGLSQSQWDWDDADAEADS